MSNEIDALKFKADDELILKATVIVSPTNNDHVVIQFKDHARFYYLNNTSPILEHHRNKELPFEIGATVKFTLADGEKGIEGIIEGIGSDNNSVFIKWIRTDESTFYNIYKKSQLKVIKSPIKEQSSKLEILRGDVIQSSKNNQYKVVDYADPYIVTYGSFNLGSDDTDDMTKINLKEIDSYTIKNNDLFVPKDINERISKGILELQFYPIPKNCIDCNCIYVKDKTGKPHLYCLSDLLKLEK